MVDMCLVAVTNELCRRRRERGGRGRTLDLAGRIPTDQGRGITLE